MSVWIINAKRKKQVNNRLDTKIKNVTCKKCCKSCLIDSRNLRSLAIVVDRFGGRRASEKMP